jgi:hypothetical protein
MKNKICTNTENAINESIQVGQFIRNGASRLFEISALSEMEIVLTCKNDERIKPTRLSRKVFAQLYFRKNYTQVNNPEKFNTECIESIRSGADRFLIKHS